MKILKIAATIMVVGAIVFLSACNSTSTSTAAKSTIATVQKGSLSVAVTGTGNLAFANSQDMAFQIAGYVQEVLVKEGDSVTKGQVLAKLDTSEWDKQIKALDSALVTAQRNLDSKTRALSKAQDQVTVKDNAIAKAQRNVTAQDTNIARAQRQVDAKVLAVRGAQLDVQASQDNLGKISDVKKIQDDIDNATDMIKLADTILAGQLGGTISADSAYWAQMKVAATATKSSAESQMQEVLKGTSIAISTNVQLQVQKAQLAIEQAQRAVDEANFTVDDAKFAVDDAKLAKTDAELAVKDAQSAKADAEQAVKDAQVNQADDQAVSDAQGDLDEAKGLSPLVTAPIDGFIPKINVKGGDEVFKGTVAMQLADPNQFQAVILVSEKNISNLKTGQTASVALDAVAGAIFPARIAQIAPLATTSQGVVNYQVTVQLTSTQPTRGGTSAQASGASSGANTQGAGSITRPSAGTSGTQGSANFTRPSTGATGSGSQGSANFTRPSAGTSGAALSGASAQTVTLKSGLSAVVTIVIQQKDNVLKIPNRAITRQGQNTTVQVINASGTETRIVKTGMSDNSNTEITEGLSEGEQVEIKATTASTSTTSNANRGGAPAIGGIRLP